MALLAATSKGNSFYCIYQISNIHEIRRKNNQDRNRIIFFKFQGHRLVVELLLQSGANVNSQDDNGSTALSIATKNSSLKFQSHFDHKIQEKYFFFLSQVIMIYLVCC